MTREEAAKLLGYDRRGRFKGASRDTVVATTTFERNGKVTFKREELSTVLARRKDVDTSPWRSARKPKEAVTLETDDDHDTEE